VIPRSVSLPLIVKVLKADARGESQKRQNATTCIKLSGKLTFPSRFVRTLSAKTTTQLAFHSFSSLVIFASDH
jgi:hypothetical protein